MSLLSMSDLNSSINLHIFLHFLGKNDHQTVSVPFLEDRYYLSCSFQLSLEQQLNTDWTFHQILFGL